MILVVWILAAAVFVAIAALGLLAGGVVLLEGLRRDRTAADRIFRVLLAVLVLAAGWAVVSRDFPLLFSVSLLLATACASMLVIGVRRHLRETFFE